ncbi:MAG: cyclic nucleotide-binding domain-containing protein [Roseobacter sp.]|jgi:hypothetical protein|nr:cyclic nucleotide-binding domain-containing protein [Roseobacter sp.]
MELTLESAFSAGGMVGHLSYLLLVVSMMMRSMTWLRLLVIASAFVAIAYDVIWLKDPVGVFWETLLVAVNIFQIAREWLNERRARFSAEESGFVRARLAALSKAQARRVLDMGVWVDGPKGAILTTEEQPVEMLVYLVAGRVDVFLGGKCVVSCGPGNFVGEMSVLNHTPASATAIIAEPSRYWMIPSHRLRDLQTSDPELAGAFQNGIARDLRNKIMSHNKALSTSA